MKEFKRAYLRIVRNISKSLVCFFLYLGLFLIINVGFNSINSIDEYSKGIQQKLGNNLYAYLYDDISGKMVYTYSENEVDYEMLYREINENEPSIIDSFYGKVVSSYSPLQLYGADDGERLFFGNESSSAKYDYNLLSSYVNDNNSMYFTLTTSRLEGVNKSNYYHLDCGEIEIVSGRNISDEEITSGANVCVISDDSIFVGPNGNKEIEVGDTIYVYEEYLRDGSLIDVKEYELSVVGLYHSNVGLINNFSAESMVVIVPEVLLDNMIDNIDYSMYENNFMKWNYFVKPIIVKTNDIDSLISFMEKYSANYTISSNILNHYQQLSYLEAFLGNIKFMFLEFVIVFILLLSAFELIDTKSNKKDIITTMKLSENNGSIVVQLCVEKIILVLSSFIVSLFIFKDKIITVSLENDYLAIPIMRDKSFILMIVFMTIIVLTTVISSLFLIKFIESRRER